LTEKGQKAARQRKSTIDKRKNAYSKRWVLLQKGGVMTMAM
jgi:hypothetical protein